MTSREQRYGALIGVLLGLLIGMALLPAMVEAQGKSAEHRTYGKGQPAHAYQLPPGQLRKAIRALPRPAKKNALKQLQDLEFHSIDTATMRVGPEGDLLYVDPPPDESVFIPLSVLPIDPGQVFFQHSKPGAAKSLVLRFKGMELQGTAWNKNADYHKAMPFDPSGDGPDFSADELSRVYAIWQRVSEDFAIFDVDVTTEEPATFTDTTGMVLITRSTDEAGICIYYCSPGGIAWLAKYGQSGYADYWGPGLCFYDNLSNGTASYTAECISHEFGHNLGLSHDGVANEDGTTASYYFSGWGEGPTSWAAIMGASYYKNVTQWSIGEYPDANNQQDDLAIISARLGYAPDTNGIINSASDTDTFNIDVEAVGTLSVTVLPNWGRYESQVMEKRGANLDIYASIMAPDRTITVLDGAGETHAFTTIPVVPGQYELTISAADDSVYSTNYAAQGMYFVTVDLTNDPIKPDPPDPPDPNQPPTAVISYTPENPGYHGGQGVAVTFDGSGSTDEDGEIVSHHWIVRRGDRVWTSTHEIFSQTLKKGNYNATLKVTDNDGDTSVIAVPVKVVREKGKP
jgi:hypothetical protein